jgi:3-oxoadipate enol-lactonase
MLERRVSGGIGYAERDADAGAPLVFLHGIGGSADVFAPQLARDWGRRALAWDMPGYGRSVPLAETTIATLAEAAVAWLERLGVAKPVLVGHSIGGMIVQEMLARRPDLPGAAVLVATSAAFGSSDGTFQREFLAARLGPLDAGRSMAELAEPIVAGMLGGAPDPEGRARAVAAMAATPEAAYRATVRALVGFDRRAALADIRVPTLLIAGEKDPNAPAATMHKMAARIAGARIVVLPGCGHLPNLEAPAAFDAALGDFLATLSDGGRP